MKKVMQSYSLTVSQGSRKVMLNLLHMKEVEQCLVPGPEKAVCDNEQG